MRFDQYSNVLTLAAALSMAGWVARSPGSNEAPHNFNDQYSFNQNGGYHPYQQFNQQWNQDYQQQHGEGPLLEQAAAPQNNYADGRNALYQSKDAEETFRAYLELQELISWHESYRRGDYPKGENNQQQYVMPVVSNNDFDLEEILDPTGNDDGYATGSSVGSPASSIVSGVSNDMGNFSPMSAENNIPNVPFFEINNHVDGPIDMDDLFGNDMSPEMPFKEPQKGPYANLLSSLDDELDYMNSPSALKNPSVDSFLTKHSPEYNPPPTFTNNKYDDPFSSLTFTNSSINDRITTDTLVDIADYDPTFIENSEEREEEMFDNALVQALSQKGKKELPGTVTIKQEDDDWLSPSSPMVEHDYFNRDDVKPLTSDRVMNKHRPQSVDELRRSRFAPFPTSRSRSLSANNRLPRGRTFAPSHTATSTIKHKDINAKTNVQRTKSTILWNDFPYTSTELVEMPVEKFNEIIKQLDEIRQHIAKDERRKGKNKLAARNCRKRKMDIIENLDHGVSGLEKTKQDLMNERKQILEETKEIKRKTEWLNNYIFQHIRDSNGLPYSQRDFSLQYTSDGNVYVVPSVGDNQRRD